MEAVVERINIVSFLRVSFFVMIFLLTFSGCENGLNEINNPPGNASERNVLCATLCPVEGCTINRVHEYNGVYYYGHCINDCPRPYCCNEGQRHDCPRPHCCDEGQKHRHR